jgi:hypothetical protein
VRPVGSLADMALGARGQNGHETYRAKTFTP